LISDKTATAEPVAEDGHDNVSKTYMKAST
jgi:hypothetical protein